MFEWMEIASATTSLGMESAAVMGLRGAALGGPRAVDEAWRMYAEKVIALCELQTGLLTGSLGATPVKAAKESLKHYRGKVAANRRRLAKS